MTVMTDITERRHIEKKLAQKTLELKRSNRELVNFSHTVSHDLQEPLSLITNYLKLLVKRNKNSLDGPSREFVNIIMQESHQIRKMIQGVLEYSQVGSIAKTAKPVDCAHAVQLALAGLQVSLSESNAQVHTGSLPWVHGDETQLVRLFQNLISNALKYRGNRKPIIRITAEKKHSRWQFSVSDNGVGIAPKNYRRIFQLFQRIDPDQHVGGTGIGLASCKKIVELHGGKIWVKSKLGKGSDFHFTLPSL
jgi:light-regulated signal transduction histidine kinase (bacteriophytochrome)